jgi:hypothetical protein
LSHRVLHRLANRYIFMLFPGNGERYSPKVQVCGISYRT